MKIVAVNGSPRKNWNTHVLLNKALEGAQSEGAETELINLYDLTYKGCTGCMACKLKNGKSLGRCNLNDELKPVLETIHSCDGLILGSPIYFSDVSAMTKAFLERFLFQYLSYDDYSQTFYNGNIKKSAFIYTMNVPESMTDKIGYNALFEKYKTMFGRFGYEQTIAATETLQVNDYSKYHMASFNEAERKERREKVFPEDCRKAYELGKSMVKG